MNDFISPPYFEVGGTVGNGLAFGRTPMQSFHRGILGTPDPTEYIRGLWRLRN
jgi:hypothetical protein